MPMISLQISQELMEEFDIIQKKKGFTSRSEALRESIKFFIRQNQDEKPSEAHQIASLTIHHEMKEDILDRFSEIIQNNPQIVKTIQQYNLKTEVIKILLVAGSKSEIDEFYNTFNGYSFFKCTISYLII